MTNVTRKSVHQALDRAASTIIAAGGRDGRASKADVQNKLKEMTGTEKSLVDTFYRFVDHRDSRTGATVTKADVTDALKLAKTRLVDAYDPDNNGLSADERRNMSKVGQLAAQVAQSYVKPLHAGQEAAKVLVSPNWQANALPELPLASLSSSARRSFDSRAKAAKNNDLLDAPIARKLTAGGQTFSIVAQFMHDSFAIELYNANGRKVATGSGWGTPTQPIEWR